MKKYFLLLFLLYISLNFNIVNAKNSELELTGDSILTRSAASGDKSAQSLSISDDYLHAFVFMTDSETPKSDAVNVDIYSRSSTSANFTYSSRVSALSYTINGATNYVEHANGSTYYKKGNEEFLLVTTKIDGTTSKYVLKYKISNNYSSITYVSKYEFDYNVVGITYDKTNDVFYVAGGSQVWRFDNNFQNGILVRKKNTGSSSPGGTEGFYYENQDVTYHNNLLYYETIVTSDNVDTVNTGTGLNLAVGESLIMVINAQTGDFVKYLLFDYSNVAEYIHNKGYHTGYTLKEIEEIVFINGEPYYLIQRSGNIVLIKSKTVTNGVGIFDYTKLYVTYSMNGGELDTTSSSITSSGDQILISGNNQFEIGSLGGQISSNGLADYNNPSYINIKKEGYHADETKEWIDSSNNTYNQATQYKVSQLADIINSDKTINLIVNWVPNTYTIVFDANGGSGTMSSLSMTYDTKTSLIKNTFTNSTNFKEWNTKSDGSGTSYSDEQEVKNLTSTNGEEVKLYAIWESGSSYLDPDPEDIHHIEPSEDETKVDNPQTGLHLTIEILILLIFGIKIYSIANKNKKIHKIK